MFELNQDKLLIASHNEGKISEFRELLTLLNIDIISSKELELPEPVEDGSTFEENALIKAKSASNLSNFISLSDDSGIEIDALDKQPGIYSARWAGPNKNFDLAMREVTRLLDENKVPVADRTARFVCALCLFFPNGKYHFFVGKIEGLVVWPPRGEYGFGYDAIFKPHNLDKTFGEITSEEKHSWKPRKVGLSHRAKAFAKFVSFLNRNDK
tara:strand:- start:438 stop:1073 length:636 start_codon:yes stop_codon:yes gene_type:complete